MLAQINLIQNSSFESVNSPVNWTTSGGFFDYTVFPEKRIVLNWEVINSPDYFSANVTYTGTFRGIPINTFGTSYAKRGNAYAGIYIYKKNSEPKEYIYQILNTPLVADSAYCLSFFTTRADRTPYAVKNLGAFFSINTPSTNASGYMSEIPQVANTSGFLTDTIGWTEIQGCFTAQGGEQYITIGNFNSNANTDTLPVLSTNPMPANQGNEYAYYYIDSVSLWQNSFPVGIKEQAKNEFVSVYPNPATDMITFKFADAIEKRRIEMHDAVGELVLSEDIITQNSSLSIHHLANGVYFYQVVQKGKTINTNKIVIIK